MAPNKMVLWQPQQQATPKKAAKNKKNTARRRNKLLAMNLQANGVPMPTAGRTQLAPTAKGIVYKSSQPQFIRGSSGACRIVHREYVNEADTQTVLGSWQTGQNVFQLNPGLPNTFPWLSRLAPNFEEYRFKKLRFVYVPRCATTTDGAVYAAIDYDSSDVNPMSLPELMSNASASQSPLWSEMSLALNQNDASFLKKRFVRTVAVPTGSDIVLYDAGKAFIVPINLGGLETSGDIYVEYDVELFTPQFSLAGFAQQNSSKLNSGGTVSPTSIFGSSPSATAGSGLGVTPQSGGTLLFQRAGQYIVDLIMSGTGMTTNPLAIAGSALASTLVSSLIGTSTAKHASYKVSVTEPGQTLQLIDDASTVTSSIARVSPYFEELN